MKIREIEAWFDRAYPKEYRCGWDNDGLLVCPDRDRTVRRVLTCLDVTFSAIEKAIRTEADLIVSHHPLIFHPLSAVNEDTIAGQKALLLLQHGLSLLSYHTRCDGAERGLNREFCALIGIRPEAGAPLDPDQPRIGTLGRLYTRMEPEELALHISKSLDAPVRLYSAGTGVEKVGVCCGGGKDLILPALLRGADAFVTGDVNYHAALDAVEAGMSVIDCGHYASERIVCELFAEELARLSPDLEVVCFHEDPLAGEIVNGRGI